MELSTLLKYWAEARKGLYEALDKLEDAQLDFTPREGLWSLRQTACHIAEAEEGWFRVQVTHELSDWRQAYYPAQRYPTVPALKALLAEVHARTERYFAEDGEAKMQQEVSLSWGPKVKVEWVFWHVLEHEIHHRGEIFLMLGLQGIEAPDV
jgi:uncharacterized damage-inducible protein DinB